MESNHYLFRAHSSTKSTGPSTTVWCAAINEPGTAGTANPPIPVSDTKHRATTEFHVPPTITAKYTASNEPDATVSAHFYSPASQQHIDATKSDVAAIFYEYFVAAMQQNQRQINPNRQNQPINPYNQNPRPNPRTRNSLGGTHQIDSQHAPWT